LEFMREEGRDGGARDRMLESTHWEQSCSPCLRAALPTHPTLRFSTSLFTARPCSSIISGTCYACGHSGPSRTTE
jgi:hypothetical protein